MSTRARIGILKDDASIESVYHHFDGYPEWLGVILNEQYNKRNKVKELIKGGDMSCCWTNRRWNKEGGRDLEVSFNGANYYSYRNQEAPSKISKNFDEYMMIDCGQEFAYIYTLENKWEAYQVYKKFSEDYTKVVHTNTRPVEIPIDK